MRKLSVNLRIFRFNRAKFVDPIDKRMIIFFVRTLGLP